MNKRVLYIGAHSDDVSIGTSIAISRDPKNSYILTISDGVVLKQKWPKIVYNTTFNNYSDYTRARLNEDKKAMKLLGVDVDNHYFNFQAPCQQTFLQFKKIWNSITNLIKSERIEKIVTHSLPEAHPDHEVASLCSHLVGQQNNIPIWEYPLYVLDTGGNKIDQSFLTNNSNKIITLNYKSNEFALRKRILSTYETQEFIRSRFGNNKSESFRLITRDLRNLPPGTGYYYGNDGKLPTPNDIREHFSKFLTSIPHH